MVMRMVEMMVMMTMVEMMAHKTEPNDYEDKCNLDAKMFAETKKISQVDGDDGDEDGGDDDDGDDDGGDDCNVNAKMFAETKKISRVESLKNLILHGKTEPELPPDVFNFPHGCSCR